MNKYFLKIKCNFFPDNINNMGSLQQFWTLHKRTRETMKITQTPVLWDSHCSYCFCLVAKQLYLTPLQLQGTPDSSVHGISQTTVLEWVAISFSRGSSPPGIESSSPIVAGRFFTIWATRKAHCSLDQNKFLIPVWCLGICWSPLLECSPTSGGEWEGKKLVGVKGKIKSEGPEAEHWMNFFFSLPGEPDLWGTRLKEGKIVL